MSTRTIYLRPNDWVYDTVVRRPVQICRAEYGTNDCIVRSETRMMDMYDIRLIPITEEFLDHNGFEEYTYDAPYRTVWSISEPDVLVDMQRTEEGYWTCKISKGTTTSFVPVQCVHELQHLLYDCDTSLSVTMVGM